MNNLQSLSLFLPEWGLLATVLLVIVVDLIGRRQGGRVAGRWFMWGLLLTFILVLFQGQTRITALFLNSLALDPFGTFFKILLLLSTFLVVFVVRLSRELAEIPMGEFYMLMGIMLLGMFLMVSAIDLIMVYLSIEVVSLSSFILSGYLKNSKRSNESALKYVIYGAFSSGLMLFGLSYLYGLTGSTKYYQITAQLQHLDPAGYGALVLAAILILAGFGYKISAVPFHFWTPDVYEGAPTTITAYLSVAPKAAGFAILIRFFHDVFTIVPDSGSSWTALAGLPWPQLLAVLSAVTMTLGNLVALKQTSVKRMLAYSSIAHAGYMLMAVPVLSRDGIFGIMIYLIMYLLMNLGAFFVVIFVENKLNSELFEDYHGLGWKI
ncbi:MAG: NADH-quinone oxidoreductase subunit N, partial [Fidelibacterota bacterium]